MGRASLPAIGRRVAAMPPAAIDKMVRLWITLRRARGAFACGAEWHRSCNHSPPRGALRVARTPLLCALEG